MEQEEKNEFAAIAEEDVNMTNIDDQPETTNSEEQEFASNSGEVYDYTQAPDSIKMPPRENLNGQTVEIVKADIIIQKTQPWGKTRDGSKDVRYCPFKLFYAGGQQESYSGIRQFLNKGIPSHPSITKDGKNQASKLMIAYADFVGKDINEVSLRGFMSFLNSGVCKGVIEGKKVTNPETGEEITKNIVVKFV